jgi:hypothetical protein
MKLPVLPVLGAFTFLLVAPGDLIAQRSPAKERARAAANQQAALREDGCGACRVWVSGPDNSSLHILDPEARTTPNDYRGYPTLWCSFGFRTVTYYTRRNAVYVQHKC